ncbi:MAG: PA2169 family four-helix-bundle protein [Sphingomicrobium sp.]
MHHDHSAEITTLNTLTATLIDSVKGYENSAKDIQSEQFREIFRQRADERQQSVEQLRGEIRKLGGDPDDNGSFLGSMHQRFEDLKAAISGNDDKAIINEVERGEDYLKEKFETALGSDTLSSDSRTVVEQAFQSVKSGHDQMSQIKHSLEASA